MLKNEEQEFIDNTIEFVKGKEWTIKNLKDAIKRVVGYMENNAVLKEELMLSTSALKETL